MYSRHAEVKCLELCSSRFVVPWFEYLVGCIEVTFLFSLLILILILTFPEGTLDEACLLLMRQSIRNFNIPPSPGHTLGI